MKKSLILSILLFVSLTVFSQSNVNSTESINKAASNTAITIANQYPDYLATPGDIYDIFFLTGGERNQTLRGFVDSDYNIDLSFIGVVNVKGLIYSEVQNLLKETILDAYPGSIVNVIIAAPGKFRVYLLGEVNQAQILDAMSLTTLAAIISGKTTNYASFRDIEIRSEDGSVKVYDLFQFTRYANKKHNPFLKPNDVITIRPYKRTVNISGEVKRPGSYQLLDGDTLETLINIYADGFTKLAQKSNIEIQRVVDKEETFYLNGDKQDLRLVKLSDFDNIKVANKMEYSSRVVIQGAVTHGNNEIINSETAKIGYTVSNKIPVTIVEGNRVSTVIGKMDGSFNLSSDLDNAFILRGSDKIDINITDVLSNINSEFDIVMEDADILVIPFKQLVVYVGGAVNSSGAVPFIENRTAEYYIGLSGGPNRSENLFGSYTVRDINGKKLPKDTIISPENVIWVKRNHPMSYLDEYATWLTTIATLGVLGFQIADYIQ
ncbi:hypothetical protein EW093_13060 [Thiospirochaeta perfilievii]|uniref:Soluble ligand binding domain-containing protein n=1 Tax=Thiospirochaeta perfilievii TaxID=252967 RepID=A0A5C1QBZ9_9SPIO|nr:SLBB domain-containing protein [Thiospirochaeta perfilievii]QEN05603.1 hypothetical protein EW093_13060 [Thiospirochaeta perfilievii]